MNKKQQEIASKYLHIIDEICKTQCYQSENDIDDVIEFYCEAADIYQDDGDFERFCKAYIHMKIEAKNKSRRESSDILDQDNTIRFGYGINTISDIYS